jgi:putrescine transport system substrate-binding protein
MQHALHLLGDKHLKKLMLASATLALIAASAHAEEVRVYNWSDYIDEALLEKFEADTGIKLIYDVIDSNEL